MPAEDISNLPHCVRKPVRRDRRTQHADRSSGLGEPFDRELPHGLERLSCRRPRRSQPRLRALHLHHDQREGLRQRVVNVTRQPVALFGRGCAAQPLRVLASESRDMRMNAAEKKAAALPPKPDSTSSRPESESGFP